ncbi:MAG: FIST C-terminal domain-containing protein [Synergistaceae bacterium]|jgi:hypothetical protein|nr:FIST C-terminal domain-containing protein [Synergistaceae bacterium]
MIKAYTAYTAEVDDVETAVAEIMEQLGDMSRLRENTVGLLACYSDFVDSGVVKKLCAALPFGVIGTTTLGSVIRDSEGRMTLSLIVLTSDDAEFATAVTEPMTAADEAPLAAAYGEASRELSVRPALMVTFAPLHVNASGDFYVDAFSRISGGVPNFGMLTVDNTSDYSSAAVICEGEAYADRCAFLLIGGSVKPEFFTASVPSERVSAEKAVITGSAGNMVSTVNGSPVADYLVKLGLKKNTDGSIIGINSFPFVVDYNDGTLPVVRVMFALTPEGEAVCGGDIPEGATISVGHIDADEVLSTTRAALSDVAARGGGACFLMFSCVGRYFALGHKPAAEMDLVREFMGGNEIPFMFVYSGGEMCPVGQKGGGNGSTLTNRNHNDTFILCRL